VGTSKKREHRKGEKGGYHNWFKVFEVEFQEQKKVERKKPTEKKKTKKRTGGGDAW